ncbi:MAG: zinc metalloprotease HtpX [Methanobacteriota archaeon]
MFGNSTKTFGLFFALALLFLLFGEVASWYYGPGALYFFLGLMVVVNFAVYFWSDRLTLAAYRAKVVTEHDAPRLHRMVAHVATLASLPMPQVAIIPSPVPNAFATGRSPSHATVAFTQGILDELSPEELEGVVAHELAHVGNRDTLLMMVAATIAGAIGFIVRMAFWGSLFGSDRDRQNLVVLLAAGILASVAAILIQMAISRTREYRADATGARFTGKPLALASALRRLERAQDRPVRDFDPVKHGNPATSHLFIANPLRGGALARLFATHPPMAERIRRLESLAAGR